MSAIPYFELHIRPMFRLIDRDHMLWKFDLWDYEQVKTNATRIQEFLRRPPPRGMPTEAAGGPWPEGWIEVFELWMDKSFPQLLLTQGQYVVQQIAGGGIVLAVSIPLDNGAAEAWLERELSPLREQFEYTVWMRPPLEGLSKPAKVALHKEILSGPIDKLFINDAAGRHEIALSS